MSKALEIWYDVETTGLDPKKGAAVCQLSAQFVVDGEVVDTLNHNINIDSYSRETTISEDALKANGRSKESLVEGSNLVDAIVELIQKTELHKQPGTKAVLIGYNNSSFDKYFIEEMVQLAGYKWWYYFNWKQVDVFELVKALQHMGIMGKTFNQKLATIAEYLGIKPEGDYHDSLVDVVVTRKIFYKLKKALEGE